MIKVAMIGAGSVVFSRNLTGDILSFPEFRNASFSYMDIDRERLEVGAALCRKISKTIGAKPKIEYTTNRRKALEGADFVINMVQIGGFNSTLVDFEIPRKYGLNFTIADTTGPGGLFRALRTYPMLTGLCRDMMEVCPRATLLNYSNPMSMNMQTIYRTSNIHAVGLCHSVQGTFDQLMSYIGEKSEDVAFLCAGINHMAFYLKLEKNGVDLYPRLFAAMKRPDVYTSNRVRFELMKVLGHFITESSEHNAEYNPYFIPRGPETVKKYDVPIDEYLRRCDGIVDEFARLKAIVKTNTPMEHHRSHEYGSAIIHSMVTGQPRVVYGNMPNRGAISNLPSTAIAEVPTLVDRSGLQFTTVGDLPPQLIAYMQPHVSQHELFIRAALESKREYVYQAAMFDPLTAATLTLDKIVELCDEMIAAHGNLLPKLDKPRLIPTSGRSFGAVNARDLRRSWDAVHRRQHETAIQAWHLIGPFKIPEKSPQPLRVKTPMESKAWLGQDGKVAIKESIRTTDAIFKWKKSQADHRGFVNLSSELGHVESVIGYGYTTYSSVHPRDTQLRCGSDDGIAIWLNGKLIHENNINRGFTPDQDVVPIHLNAGENHLVVKIHNNRGGWGFGVSIDKANF